MILRRARDVHMHAGLQYYYILLITVGDSV